MDLQDCSEPEVPTPEELYLEDETSSNFLATYFKEMSRLPILHPNEEYAIAEKIAALETSLWVVLLSFSPLCDLILCSIEQEIQESLPSFRGLRKLATQDNQSRLLTAATEVAEILRERDIDRVFVTAALHTADQAASHTDPAHIRFRRDIQQIHAQIKKEKNSFVKANLRLVVSIARRFNHGRMPLSDLIQEGNIGLIKAVERFDYRKGFRFSTYASWWIRHAISRGLADKGRAVRLPVHMIDVHHRIARSRKELSTHLGRPPSDEELSEATGLPMAKIEKMHNYLFDQSLSLDRNISDNEGRKFIDTLQDESTSSHPVENLFTASLATEVHRLLSFLKPIEADILRQRFGLYSDEESTLKDVGEKYNLSRERIRQLQEQALFKMRKALQQQD